MGFNKANVFFIFEFGFDLKRLKPNEKQYLYLKALLFAASFVGSKLTPKRNSYPNRFSKSKILLRNTQQNIKITKDLYIKIDHYTCGNKIRQKNSG